MKRLLRMLGALCALPEMFSFVLLGASLSVCCFWVDDFSLGYLLSSAPEYSEIGLLVNLSAKGVFGITAIPLVVLIPLLTLFVVWFFLNHTRTGRSIYAIGSNPDAAVLLGLPVRV